MQYHLNLFLIIIFIKSVFNQIEQAAFETLENTDYIVSKQNNFITNITNKYPITDCANQCLKYSICQTATYYIQTRICSLYQEKSGLGQRITVDHYTASLMILKYRIPPGKIK